MTTESSNVAGVLVVEDDRNLAELYAEWLEGTYDVATAYDGADALERLDETVDVVLLDRMMPGLSGDEVLKAIRNSDVDTQVVMVSAVTPDLDIVQMGFDGYLEKPVDASVLQDTLDRMLTRAKYDEKLQELFSLIERQDALEAVKKAEVLENDEKYRSLIDRLESVQAEVETLLTELPDEDFRVAVERFQRTASERTSERRYESLTEDVLDSSREATVVVDAEGAIVWANEATEQLLGVDRSDARGREYATFAAEQLQGIEADGESLASLIRTGLASHGRELNTTVHVPGDEERSERWLEYWSAPIRTGLYTGGRIEHYHDTTAKYRRNQYLQTLHSATRTLMTAETRARVADTAVTTATGELDFPYAAVFARDDGTGDLVPAASDTTDSDAEPTLPTVSGGSDPIWTAFTNQSDQLDAETHRERDGSGGWLDQAFDDWLLCSLGQQGVFLVAVTGGEALSDTKRNLAQTWAANMRQALKQITRTRRLRDRDRELERQNDRLSRLNRINRLIRSVSPAVVSADTRAEIETEVCRRLLQIDPVTGVWVADVHLPSDATVCRASAGDLDGYLSDIPRAAADGDIARVAEATPPVPARQAYEARSSVAVTDLVDVDSGVWWRAKGLKRGTNTIVAIPVVHESTCFGTIEVHIDRPRGMVNEEVDALAELGVTIGHAIGAIRQRDALLAGGATSLTFHIESNSALSRLITEVDAGLTVTDVSQQDDGTCAVFVALDVDADHNRDQIAERLRNRTAASVLRSHGTRITCVVTLPSESPIQQMVRRGVALQEVEIRPDSEDLAVTVRIPYETRVREYVDAVTDAVEGAELVAKQSQSVDRQSSSTVATAVDASLTDRQRETLQMAFHMGYFSYPRNADAETVAEEIGIAQSTLSQHLRTAERKLLEELFL